MENFCLYVNSRGILKSCDFHSSNPASDVLFFEKENIEYLSSMLKNMFNGMTIYVCSSSLDFFVKNILSKINRRFILVSGDSDLSVPNKALSESDTFTLLNSQCLIRWFSQNACLNGHNKFFQIPIGLDFHTISNNPKHSFKLPQESHLPKDQEKILTSIKEESKPFYERTSKIYINFTTHNDRYAHRKSALETISKDLLEISNNFSERTNKWKEMILFSFVLSPFGNGMDTHRTWEALCLGCIPIVKSSTFSQLFEDLPVLIVNDWNEVTRDLLDKTIEDFKERSFNYEKLHLKYWVNKIKNLQTNTSRVLLTTIAIGEKYLQEYKTQFQQSQHKYALKNGYEFKVITEFLDRNFQEKCAISFNKILVCSQDWSEKYDFIIFVDADIFININSPPIHTFLNYENSIGIVDEYSQPSKERRINIQKKMGWETSAKDYYKLCGFDIETESVFNSGVLVLQPKQHRYFLENIYNKYVKKSINHPRGFHFEQSCIGYEIQKANMFKILDNKFNAVLALTELDNVENITMEQYHDQNYFIHFAGRNKQHNLKS